MGSVETKGNSNRGEFYTPKSVSDKLYEMTQEVFPGFNENFVVWDCCWGTGNLTKDYKFNNLFCSTIQKSDLRNNKNNPNSVKFQYDFLNKDINLLVSPQDMWLGETEIPEELDAELRDKNGKDIIFYINPPYVATGLFGSETDYRGGQSKSEVRNIMGEDRMGVACDQAYSQFLYRIILMREAYPNKKIHIALISPCLFLTSAGYKKFRDRFFDNFKLEKCALFQANVFDGVSGTWGLILNIYSAGKEDNRTEFLADLLDKDLNTINTKKLYNMDNGKVFMDWVKGDEIDNVDVVSDVTLSSGCKVSNKKQVRWADGSIGYMFYRGNNVYHNTVELGVMSQPYSNGSGMSITKENVERVLSAFCVRKVFSGRNANWVNDKDEFSAPDENSKEHKIISANSLVYSLFQFSFQASSLVVSVDNKTVDIPNNFYHISFEDTKKAFSDFGLEIQGPKEYSDRIAVSILEKNIKSGLMFDGYMKLLDVYRDLWYNSIKDRSTFNEKIEQYQVLNWDASMYQIKWMLKETRMEQLNEFRQEYNKVTDSLKELIYDCKILRR